MPEPMNNVILNLIQHPSYNYTLLSPEIAVSGERGLFLCPLGAARKGAESPYGFFIWFALRIHYIMRFGSFL